MNTRLRAVVSFEGLFMRPAVLIVCTYGDQDELATGHLTR
jgi:hypothetical protein